MSALEDLGGGLWRWTARHPDWHPRTDFGAAVACFAAHHGGATVLIDPLLDAETSRELDAIVSGEVVVAVTIPYHVRDAARAAGRWGATVVGHRDLQRRLPDGTRFTPAAPGDELPGGLRVHAVKRLKEQPVELPGLGALAFGDRVVGVDGRLRVWIQRPITDARRAWFAREAVPALEPLLALDPERILVTHGAPVLRGGRQALEDALAAGPWYHRPT